MRETDLGPGRPDADECLPYSFTYIDLVPDGHKMKLPPECLLSGTWPIPSAYRARRPRHMDGRSSSPATRRPPTSRLACWAMSSPNAPVTPVPNSARF